MNRLFLRTLLPLAAVGALAACATPSDGDGPTQAITPTEQFQLRADTEPEELHLAPHREGLSRAQAAALSHLADNWRRTGGGMIRISAPRGVDERASYVSSVEARDALVAAGVPPERIERVGYDARGDRLAPVVVGFASHAAEVPQCGRDWDNLTATKDNKPYANFGCAITANMAAEIADPADIAQPRALDPADAGRRTTALEKYRASGSGGTDSGSGAASGSSATGASGASGGGASTP